MRRNKSSLVVTHITSITILVFPSDYILYECNPRASIFSLLQPGGKRRGRKGSPLLEADTPGVSGGEEPHGHYRFFPEFQNCPLAALSRI